MSFRDFISTEIKSNLSNCKDRNYVIKGFEKYCKTELDAIQYIQLQELYNCCNFTEILISAIETKDKKILAAAIGKISKEFDEHKISVSVYAHYLYCIMEHTGLVNEIVDWVDPRELNHSDLGKVSTNPTFGLGAFKENNADFEVKDRKLVSLKDDRIMVTIPYGIKEISSNVFKGKKNIKMISVPNSVNILPENLFTGLPNLEAVVLPQSIDEVPKNFVKNCKKLKLVLGSGVQKINDHAFENTSLLSVKRLGNGTFKYIGEAAFKNCVNLKYLDLSNTQIEDGALEGTSVTKLTIGKNTTIKRLVDLFTEYKIDYRNVKLEKISIEFLTGVIPSAFFEDLVNLKEVEIIGNIHTIEAGAFKKCASLVNISIKGNVTTIKESAFDGCENLTTLNINYTGNVLPAFCFSGCEKLNLSNILSNIEVLENNSLTLDSYNGSFDFLPKLKVVKKDAFVGTNKVIDTFEIPDGIVFEKGSLRGLKIKTFVVKNLNMKDSTGQTFYPYMYFEDALDKFNQTTAIKNVLIKTDDIVSEAFKGWTKLEKVKFAVPISRIPGSCFEGCASLISVLFDSKDVSIGDRAFYGCNGLERINSKPGENVLNLNMFKSIGKLAFNNCSSFKHIDMTNISRAEQLMFNGCYGIESIVLTTNKTDLPFSSLFENDVKVFNSKYKNLQKITIYVNERIPNNYFRDCIHVEEINIVNDVLYLGDASFAGCKGLKTLNMNYVGNTFPSRCFDNCINLDISPVLKNVEILESNSLTLSMINGDLNNLPKLKRVKPNAFISSNEEIPQMELPSHVVFERNSLQGLKIVSLSFTNLKLENAMMPYMLFEDTIEQFNQTTAIRNIKILTSDICDSAFKNWTTLEKVKIESKINLIPESCFEGCINLESIKFDSDNIKIGNRAFYDCKRLVRINALVNTDMIDFNKFDSIGSEAFTNCESFVSIDMSSVTSYDNLMFKGCYSITNLLIGANEKSKALYTIFETDPKEFSTKYKNFKKVKVYVEKEIPTEYFKDCIDLVEIDIVGNVEKLNDSAFERCHSLTHLNMNYIGYIVPKNCFKECYNIEILPEMNNVMELNEGAFEACHKLQTVKLSQNIRKLGNKAFKECSQIITLPFNITANHVGDYAFECCYKLSAVSLVNVSTLGKDVFRLCQSLKHIDVNVLKDQTLSEIFGDTCSIESIKFMGSEIPSAYFKNLEQLRVINFDKPIQKIGNFAFMGCSSLTKLPRWDNVSVVGSFAFMNTGIEECIISKDAKYVGIGIFAECKKLQSIELPLYASQFGLLFSNKQFEGSKELVQKNRNIERKYHIPSTLKHVKITNFYGGNAAFSCVNIEDFKIECDIVDVPNRCFYEFAGNIDIDFTKIVSIGYAAFAGTNIGNVELTNVEKIGGFAFIRCRNLEILKMGYNVEYIDHNATAGSNIKKLDIISNQHYRNEEGMIISNRDSMVLFVNKNTIGDIVVPEDMEIINSHAFENCHKITSIDTSNVKIIKNSAFSGCSQLEKLIMNSCVEQIEEGILVNSKDIKNLTIPFIGSNVDDPDTLNYLFEKTQLTNELNLKVLDGKIIKEFNGSVVYFGTLDLSNMKQESFESYTFNYLNIKKLMLSDNLTTLEKNVFVRTYIQEIESNSLENDGNFIYTQDSIYYCYNPNITTLKVAECIKEVKNDALENISLLESIIVESKDLQSNRCFANIETSCIDITQYKQRSLTLEYEFSGSLSSLRKVIYHGENIDPLFFEKADGIKEIVLTDVLEFQPKVFSGLKSKKIDLLELDNIRELYSLQFSCSPEIDNLILSNKIFKIASDAFINSVINNIEIPENDYYEMVDKMLISKKQNSLIFACRTLQGSVTIPRSVKRIESDVFNHLKITEIYANNVEYIENGAFSLIKSVVQKVEIGSSALYIGSNIFYNTEVVKLKLPYVGSTLNEANEANLCYLFNTKTRNVSKYLEKVIVTDQENYEGTFAYCSKVKEIIISANTKKIGRHTFLKCSSLTKFIIPKNVEYIDELAFEKCSDIVLYIHPAADDDKWHKKYAVIKPMALLRKNREAKKNRKDWYYPSYEL